MKKEGLLGKLYFMGQTPMTFKPLDEKEEKTLLELLLRLFQTTKNQNILRSAKGLFGILTQYRFTPDENKSIDF